MRASNQRKQKNDETKMSPNKQFLAVFLNSMFQRQLLNESLIRSFNYFFMKRNHMHLKAECSRIQKGNNNIDNEISLMCKFLQTLIANMEEILKKPQILPYLNVTFRIMIEFVSLSLSYLTEEKVPRPEHWTLMDNIFDMFDYIEKWQTSESYWKQQSNVPEDDLNETCQKIQQNMNWVDQYPLFSTNFESIHWQTDILNVLTEWCFIDSIENSYNTMLLTILQQHTSQDGGHLINTLLHTIQLSLVGKKQAVQKTIRVYGKCRKNIDSRQKMMLDMINRVRLLCQQQKTCRYYIDVLGASHLETILTAEQLLSLSVDILSDIARYGPLQSYKDIHKLINHLTKYSYLFSQIQNQPSNIFMLYPILVRIALTCSDTEQKEWKDSICQGLLTFFNNVRIRQPIRNSQEVLNMVVDASQPDVQQFILKSLPGLIKSMPQLPPRSASNFTLLIYLKCLVAQPTTSLLKNALKEIDGQPLTTFLFLVTLHLLKSSKEPQEGEQKLVETIINGNNRLHYLVLLISSMNSDGNPIFRFSIKDLMNDVTKHPQKLSQSIVLPALSTNEAYLFSSKHQLHHAPNNIDKLVKFINVSIDKILPEQRQSYLHALVQLNKMSKQTTLPNQYQVLMRIRQPISLENIVGSFETAFNTETFSQLIKIFNMADQNSTDPLYAQLHNRLLNLLRHVVPNNSLNFKQLNKIYEIRKQGESTLGNFGPYLQYIKNHLIVKFYSQTISEDQQQMRILMIQLILRILLKIDNIVQMGEDQNIGQVQLIYLPVESIHLTRDVIDSDLFLTFVMMSMHCAARDNDKTDEIRVKLLANVGNVATILENKVQILKIIKFQEIFFLQKLVSDCLSEWRIDNSSEDLFPVRMLNQLLSTSISLADKIVELFKTGHLEQKLSLIYNRMLYILKKPELQTNSKEIYSFFHKINEKIQSFWFNPYLKKICLSDGMQDMEHSCQLLRQLIQAKDIIKADEALADVIFEHIAKLSEFYKEVKKQNLLVLIPKLVCSLFNIDINLHEKKQPLSEILQMIEKMEKPATCVNNGGGMSQSIFRCLDCQENKFICFACAYNCHNGHAISFVNPANNGNKYGCHCPGIPQNVCKLKKQKKDQVPDLRMVRGRNTGGSYDLPPIYDQLIGLPPGIHPSSIFNYQGLNSFRFGDFSNPMDARQELIRWQRLNRFDRYQNFQPQLMDEEANIFESADYRRNRFKAVPLERRQTNLVPDQPAEEEPDESDEYENIKDNASMEVEDLSDSGNIIKSQSFLLHIFLQIAQELCLSRGRKASLIEDQAWKFNFAAPALQRLCDYNARLAAPNSYKTKMSGSDQVRDMIPSIARKPIAVGPTYTLVLSCSTLSVYQNKRILAHLSSRTTVEHVSLQGLPMQCHSVEFCPNNPSLICVAGMTSLIVMSLGEDGTLVKRPDLTNYANRAEYINKMQYLELGVMFGDTKSIKLNSGKSNILTIHAAKDDGLIRDWHALKLTEPKYTNTTYLLTVITAYNNVFTLQFDENDRGEKTLTNKVQFEKRKDPGSSIRTGYLVDGSKYIIDSFKPKDSNFIGKLEGNMVENMNFLKFYGLHPNFDKNYIIGLISQVYKSPDKLVFCCTLKPELNKDNTSVHSGQLTVFSLSQNQKFTVQPLMFSPNDTRCQGFGVMSIDNDTKLILSLHQDGTLNAFVYGELKKDTISKAIKALEQKNESVDQKQSSASMQDIRKLILDKIKLPVFHEMQLNPVIDFKQRSEVLKKPVDYRIERSQNEATIQLNNKNKIITGFTFPQSHKVVLPTRTINNAVQVPLSPIEMLYYNCLDRITIKFQRIPNGAVFRDNRGRYGPDLSEELDISERIFMQPSGRQPQNELAVYGQNVESHAGKFRMLRDLIENPNNESLSNNISEIFSILKVFLREIRDSENSMMSQEELMTVVESFKPILLRADCQFYVDTKTLIELCIEIINNLQGNKNVPIGHPMDPQTYTFEPILKEMNRQANCAFILKELERLALYDTQRFYYWICRYRQIVKGLYNKFIGTLAKDDKFKGKQHERPLEVTAERLICLIVGRYRTITVKTETDCQGLFALLKSLFLKYGGGKDIRRAIYKYASFFYDKKPAPWVQTIQPIEQEIIADLNEPTEVIPTKKVTNNQASQLLYMQMAEVEDEEIRLAMLQSLQAGNMLNQIEQIEEEKMEMEDAFDMPPIQEQKNTTLLFMNGNYLLRDLFVSCIKSFETEETMDTARYSILMGYVLFKIINKVSPQSVIPFVLEIVKWLEKLKMEKNPSITCLSYLGLFSKIIQNSVYLNEYLDKPQSYYGRMRELILERARQFVQLNINPNKKTQRARLSLILNNKSLNQSVVSFAHSLMSLLRNPMPADPVILSLKCYWLLQKDKQEYKKERDRVIYRQCMKSNDVSKIYKKARKRPEIWKECANLEWLQKLIDEKKQGWKEALQLLALYYE